MRMDKLVMDNVSKRYGSGDTAVKALEGVSLAVREGEFVAIVGPSGSGKTTFLAAAGALLQPTSGRIALNGIEFGGKSAAELTKLRLRHIGFILQSSNLVPYLTALDQLLLLPNMTGLRDRDQKKRAVALLTELGLDKRFHHYPESLSGGEKQRVAIARALMNDPDLILADEPTASLDTQRGREVVRMLAHEAKSRRKAAIMVTHDERMLDLCDRVLRMTDGKLTEASRAAV